MNAPEDTSLLAQAMRRYPRTYLAVTMATTAVLLLPWITY